MCELMSGVGEGEGLGAGGYGVAGEVFDALRGGGKFEQACGITHFEGQCAVVQIGQLGLRTFTGKLKFKPDYKTWTNQWK